MPMKQPGGRRSGGRSIAVTHFVQREHRDAEASWPSAIDPAYLASSRGEVSTALSIANGPQSLESGPGRKPRGKVLKTLQSIRDLDD